MLFNSLHFFIFFPLVTGLYFLLPGRFRWLLLLVSSCYFYMVFVPWYILILFFTIFVDYFAGILIEKSQGRRRKFFLVASLLANVGILGFFKYFNFFAQNINDLAHLLKWNYSLELLGILLPIGLSFHTFQAMSYTIEVYRGKQAAEKHFGIYALYVMFFPQLVAGPIERPQNLLPQFHRVHDFDYRRAVDGLVLMAWGLFKKVVIADRLAVFVNQAFGQPHNYGSLQLLVAVLLFAYQIYCDFSGYSDIALGSAQLLGFDLMKNFDRPYYSKSVSEFWRRWHISLFSWFRDYVYYPIALGGKRGGRLRIYWAVFVTFLISGLWHGADWKYVVLGLVSGVSIILSMLLKNIKDFFAGLVRLNSIPKLRRVWQILVTFAIVNVGWVFFRANSVHDGVYIIEKIIYGLPSAAASFRPLLFWQSLSYGNGLSKVELLIGLAAVVVLEAVHLFERSRDPRRWLASQPWWIRWTVYYALVLVIVFFGKFGDQQFIYFQF